MTPLGRAAMVSLLVPALALRALTALYVELQGPLHFHLDDDHHEHRDQGDGHAHAHSHGHGHSERHHHPAGDPTVVTLEDHAGLDGPASEETAARGWSATMCVALVSAHAWPDPPPAPNGIAPANEKRLQTRFPGRLERPPRPASA